MSKIFQNNLVVWQMHSTLDFSESGSIATRCAAEERDGGWVSRAKVRDAAGTKARACPRARGSADRVLLALRGRQRPASEPRSRAAPRGPGCRRLRLDTRDPGGSQWGVETWRMRPDPRFFSSEVPYLTFAHLFLAKASHSTT